MELRRNVERIKELEVDLRRTKNNLDKERASGESLKYEQLSSFKVMEELKTELADLKDRFRRQKESHASMETENLAKEEIIQSMREAAKNTSTDYELIQEELEKSRFFQNELEAEVAHLREQQTHLDEVRAHERELETKVESLQETITKIGEDG